MTLAGFLWELFSFYVDILVIALIVQFIRWCLQDESDEPQRSLKSFVAGAFMWPFVLFRECSKLVRDKE